MGTSISFKPYCGEKKVAHLTYIFLLYVPAILLFGRAPLLCNSNRTISLAYKSCFCSKYFFKLMLLKVYFIMSIFLRFPLCFKPPSHLTFKNVNVFFLIECIRNFAFWSSHICNSNIEQ